MKLFRYTSLKEFKKQVYPFLLLNEAENSFVFDLAQRIERTPKSFEEIHFWSILEDSKILLGSLSAKGIENKSFFAVSKSENKDAIKLIAKEFSEISKNEKMPMITLGCSKDSRLFSETLKEIGHIKDFEVKMKMTLYTLKKENFQFIKPKKEGELILATKDHFDIILQFHKQFMIDTFGEDSKMLGSDEDYTMRINKDLENEYIYLLRLKENSEIVSMCSKTGSTPNGFRIGMVFTPIELRKNGYGSAVTAGLCDKIFQDGGSLCTLFADELNPTSNKIYKNIGFVEKESNEIHSYQK